ncbi:FecCD family ABC transporter permease [Paenibacillus senegalensis]|uniref:FecCD family ABC transporter permease n=1 Tax=Paenibacillus senegalensis TaxID=1465766 RepID=UPI0002897701|nr:iron ABC transporter permease [Paenibacillus senegalensis]
MIPLFRRTSSKAAGLMFGLFLLVAAFLTSIVLGATKIPFQAAVESFFHYDVSSDVHVIVQTARLPRAIMATVAGMNLAMAGALMQALTRNPLASPGIFGVNAGAVFFVVIALSFLPISSFSHLIWFAFLGAGVAAATVYALGSLGREGLTPVKIVLAGAAMTALFSSFTQGILVLNESGLQDVLFWLAGSIAGRETDTLLLVLPYMIPAIAAALLLGRPINILTSGEDIAKGLGQKTILVKTVIALTVVVLAGSTVATVGAIGFVGLVMPHVARFFVGVDYRWVIPYSAVLGSILMLLADVAVRFIIMPGEVPVGIMTALIGAPFFVYIARKGLAQKG